MISRFERVVREYSTSARIARCDGLKIPDAVVAARPRQREDGALRVRTLDDPVAARHFDGAFDDLAAAGLHALRRRIDIADVEVVEPERDRDRQRLGEHAADRYPTGGEQLVRAHRADVGV